MDKNKRNQLEKTHRLLSQKLGDAELSELRLIRRSFGNLGKNIANALKGFVLQAVVEDVKAINKAIFDQIKATLNVNVAFPEKLDSRITNWEEMPQVAPVVNVTVPDTVTLSDKAPTWYVAPQPTDMSAMATGLQNQALGLIQLAKAIMSPVKINSIHLQGGNAPLGVYVTNLAEMWKGVTLPVSGGSSSGGGSSGSGVVQQGARDTTAENWYAQLRTAAGVSYDARDRSWTITETVSVLVTNFPSTFAVTQGTTPWVVGFASTPDVNVTDRAARLLGVVYGDKGQLSQRTSTLELNTYDTNIATVLGTSSLISSGRVKVESSPTSGATWDISDRAGRLVGIVYGNLDKLQQKASTLELLTYDNNLATVFGTASLISSGRVKVDGSGVTQPISAVSLPLPTGAATETTLGTRLSESDFDTKWAAGLDVTSRAGRLVGIVYGSQGQLSQRASTLELNTYDTNLATVFGTSSLISSSRLKVESSPTSGSVWDVSDRAARLLGVVYGSQGQQLSQKASTFELNTYDTNLASILGTSSLLSSGRVKVEALFASTPTVDVEYKLNTTARTTRASISIASSGDNLVVAAVTAQTVRVHKLIIVVADDVTVQIVDGTGTAMSGVMTMLKGGSIVLDMDAEPWYVTSAGNGFNIKLGGAVQVSGSIWYSQS